MGPHARGRLLAPLGALSLVLCLPEGARADDPPPAEDPTGSHLRIKVWPVEGAPADSSSVPIVAHDEPTTTRTAAVAEPPGWKPDARCDDDGCADFGRCTFACGDCVVGSADDCEQSNACAEDGECFFEREARECSDGMMLESPSTFAAGIVFTALGAVAVPTGMFLARSADLCESESCSAERRSDSSAAVDVGNALAFGGALSLIVGVAALIAGSHEVLKTERYAAVPALNVGPGGGTLVWTF